MGKLQHNSRTDFLLRILRFRKIFNSWRIFTALHLRRHLHALPFHTGSEEKSNGHRRQRQVEAILDSFKVGELDSTQDTWVMCQEPYARRSRFNNCLWGNNSGLLGDLRLKASYENRICNRECDSSV